MAAATKDRADSRSDGEIKAHPVADAVKIYKNTLVLFESATGYVIPAADVATSPFAGVSMEQADNTGGVDGAIKCRIRKTGEYEFAIAAATQATVGLEVYLTDDSTVQTADNTNNHNKVGVVEEVVTATLVRVRINGYAK